VLGCERESYICGWWYTQANVRNSWALLGKMLPCGCKEGCSSMPPHHLRTWLGAFKTPIHHVQSPNFFKRCSMIYSIIISSWEILKKNLQSLCTLLSNPDLSTARPNNPVQASSQSIRLFFSTSKFQCCEILPAKEAYVGFCFRWECPISRTSVARKCIKERELLSSSILFTVISFPSSFNMTSCAAHISQLHK